MRTAIALLSGLVLMACAGLIPATAAMPAAGSEPACSVVYEQPDSDLARQLDQQLRLRADLPAVLPDGKVERHASGAGTTAGLVIHRPDTMRPGPWATVLEMNSRSGHRTVLEVSEARDHAPSRLPSPISPSRSTAEHGEDFLLYEHGFRLAPE